MIVKMKKLRLITLESEQDKALNKLGNLGVIHVSHKDIQTRNVTDFLAEKDRLIKLVATVSAGGKDSPKETIKLDAKADSLETVCLRIEAIQSELRQAEERILFLNKESARIKTWGNFDPASLQSIKEKGFYTALYELSLKKQYDFDEDVFLLTVKEEKSQKKVLAFSKNEIVMPDAEAIVLPEESLNVMIAELKSLENKIVNLKDQLYSEKVFVPLLTEGITDLEHKINYESVRSGMEQEGILCSLEGFFPAEETDRIKAIARQEGWGLVLDEPVPGDAVPTKIKNNRFVKIIKPVFDILGTVPGYFEADISFYFLLFFSIFFAMIIGDAGYGSIFLVGTIMGHISIGRKKKALPDGLKLLYVLSICTIVWGTITGNWFGSDAIAQFPLLKNLTIPGISSFPAVFSREATVNNSNVMYICFILGVVQLSIACIKSFIDQLPELKSIANLGWLCVIDGLYFLVLNLVIKLDFPSWAAYLIGFGVILIIVFGAQEKDKNFFKGFLAGLGGLFNTFLDVISSFSNIISYIRLFAVGMASVAIASSFNDMAAPMLGSWAFIGAILILVLGHGLNLAMGLLSVVVHGIRLNMLEFSGQLGLEWTGIKYEPFMDQKKDSK